MSTSLPRFGRFSARTDCNRCGNPVPLNAPAQAVHCTACQADIAIPVALWQAVLQAFDEKHRGLAAGAVETVALDVHGLPVRSEHCREAPACGGCSRPFPPEQLDGERDLVCPACGEGAASFAAPAWLTAWVPTARHVIVTEKGARAANAGAAPLALPNADKPVVMPCPQCGAALHVSSDTARLVGCQFCKAEVYLPDDLWRRLHPARTVRPWYVRFEGQTRGDVEDDARVRADAEAARIATAAADAEREQRVQREAQAAAAARRKEEEIAKLTRHGYGYALGLAAVLGGGAGCNALAASTGAPSNVRSALAVAALVIAIVAIPITFYATSRPIQRRTGWDRTMMFFVAGFFVIFGLLMPIAGQIIVIVVGLARLLKNSIGGGTITSGSSSRYYEDEKLPAGEGRPLGVAYLALGFLWPLLIATTASVFTRDVTPPTRRRLRHGALEAPPARVASAAIVASPPRCLHREKTTRSSASSLPNSLVDRENVT